MTTQEIKKQMQVLEAALDYDGLWIRYTLNGEKKILCAEPWEAARLLESNAVIENYHRIGEDEKPTIAWIKEKDDCDVCKEDCWDQFIEDFHLSQWDAIGIAVNHEYQKHLQKIMKDAAEKNRLQYLAMSIQRGMSALVKN